MNNCHLTDVGGQLELGQDVLIYHYPAGDIDTIPWPLKCEFRGEGEVRVQLASCLFGERECGSWDGDHVYLPDGTPFYPEDYLK